MTAQRSAGIELRAEPFDHQNGGDWPGWRGARLSMSTGYDSGRVFSTEFPTIWVTEANDVEMDEGRYPLGVFRQWLAAVLEATEDTASPIVDSSGEAQR